MHTLLRKFIKQHFSVKTLLFFVHLRSQQKRTQIHLQLSNLQCCHFNIVILRVAIITNVQNSAFSIDTGRQTMTPLVDVAWFTTDWSSKKLHIYYVISNTMTMMLLMLLLIALLSLPLSQGTITMLLMMLLLITLLFLPLPQEQ